MALPKQFIKEPFEPINKFFWYITALVFGIVKYRFTEFTYNYQSFNFTTQKFKIVYWAIQIMHCYNITLHQIKVDFMKKLFIIRHAKSSWDDPLLTDFERPLNFRGKRDGPNMASIFCKANSKIDLIAHSPAKRAVETANFFIRACSKSKPEVVVIPEIYDASLNTLKAVVNNFSDQYSNIIMVGHNPGFSMLVGHFTDQVYDMPTCSISEIDFDHESWSHCVISTGRLVNFDYPKKHYTS